MFKKMSEITLPSLRPKDLHLDTLWYALHFNPKIDPESRPGWKGYMSMVSSGDYPGKSTVHMLPIIDLGPNKVSCIYSNLSFIIQQSQELELQTPISTFDQSLWIKANKNCTCKVYEYSSHLWRFSNHDNFYREYWFFNEWVRSSRIIETCYGKNTLKHMLTGKAIARALRGYSLLRQFSKRF